jgi:hypothetical protein
VREGDVDLVRRAAALDELTLGLCQLVVTERDRQWPDHRRRSDRDACERLLGVGPRSQLVLEDLLVDATVERCLPRRDRVGIVLARPFPELH